MIYQPWFHAEFEWWSLKEYSNHDSTPQELGMLKRERSERFYFLVLSYQMCTETTVLLIDIVFHKENQKRGGKMLVTVKPDL